MYACMYVCMHINMQVCRYVYRDSPAAAQLLAACTWPFYHSPYEQFSAPAQAPGQLQA